MTDAFKVATPSSGPWTFAQLQSAAGAGFNNHLGFELLEASDRRVLLRLQLDERHRNSVGGVHGGVLMALADAAGAFGTLYNLPQGARTATTDSQTQFLRPASGATLHAEADLVRMGKSRAVWLTKITNQEGRVIAQVTQAQAIILNGEAQNNV